MKADRKSKLGDLIYISKIKLNILSIGHDNIKKRIKIFEFSTFDKPGMKDFRLDVKQKCRGIRIPTLFKNWGSVWITVGDDLVEPMAYSKVNITRGRELNYPLPSIDLDNARLGREPITEEREPGNFFTLRNFCCWHNILSGSDQLTRLSFSPLGCNWGNYRGPITGKQQIYVYKLPVWIARDISFL